MKTKAIITLRWPDGRKDDIGELVMEYTKDGAELKPRWNVTRRFGWAMMKQGFIMMLNGDQPESEDDIFGSGKKNEN